MSMLSIEVAKQPRISPYNVTYSIKIDVYKHLVYALLLHDLDLYPCFMKFFHLKYVGGINFGLVKLFIKS